MAVGDWGPWFQTAVLARECVRLRPSEGWEIGSLGSKRTRPGRIATSGAVLIDHPDYWTRITGDGANQVAEEPLIERFLVIWDGFQTSKPSHMTDGSEIRRSLVTWFGLTGYCRDSPVKSTHFVP